MPTATPQPDNTEIQLDLKGFDGRSVRVDLTGVHFGNGCFAVRCRPCGEIMTGAESEFATITVTHAETCVPRLLSHPNIVGNPGLSRRGLLAWAITVSAILALLTWAVW